MPEIKEKHTKTVIIAELDEDLEKLFLQKLESVVRSSIVQISEVLGQDFKMTDIKDLETFFSTISRQDYLKRYFDKSPLNNRSLLDNLISISTKLSSKYLETKNWALEHHLSSSKVDEIFKILDPGIRTLENQILQAKIQLNNIELLRNDNLKKDPSSCLSIQLPVETKVKTEIRKLGQYSFAGIIGNSPTAVLKFLALAISGLILTSEKAMPMAILAL